MGSITKSSKQAKALFDLYRTMSEKIQKEVLKMILDESIESNYSDSIDYSKWSEETLEDIWSTRENDHWDDYFKSNGYV